MIYRINDIYTTKPGWIQVVGELMDKYFVQDQRTRVRSTALQCLLQIYKSNRQMHEDEIFRELILPIFGKDGDFDKVSELNVRLEGIKVCNKKMRKIIYFHKICNWASIFKFWTFAFSG